MLPAYALSLALAIAQPAQPERGTVNFTSELLPLDGNDLADALGILWLKQKLRFPAKASSVTFWLVEWKKTAGGEGKRTGLDGGIAIGAAVGKGGFADNDGDSTGSGTQKRLSLRPQGGHV